MLNKKLYSLLSQKNIKISTVESCTGGGLSSAITEISGVSKFYEIGYITYSNEAKVSILGLSPDIIDKFGAVSAECAHSMAEQLLLKSGADISISITGIAGPTGGTAEKRVGSVYIGVGINKGDMADIKVYSKIFSGSRKVVRKKSVKWSLKYACERIEQEM